MLSVHHYRDKISPKIIHECSRLIRLNSVFPKKMETEDTNWDAMCTMAKNIQQEFYEFLPEWTNYKEEEYEYLKQNIAYALYGPPTNYEDCDNDEVNSLVVCTQTELDSESKITDTVKYKPEVQRHIDALFEKIYNYGNGYEESASICFGLIYNVIYRTKKNDIPKKESSENTNEQTPIVENEEEKTEEKLEVLPMPIFKVKRFVKKEESTSGTTYIHDTLFIDITGRTYYNWPDYINENILHECTMVVPKDGVYQPDPEYEITENQSVVWLEVTNSPACNVLKKFLNVADTTSSVAGTIGLGLAITSVFTPVAPVVLTAGAVASIASCVWTAGRSTGSLIDRSTHDESINITDQQALCSWLGLAGSVLGVTASGGSYFLSRAVQSGQSVGKVVQIGYNSILIAGVGVNGVGIGIQAYNLYQGYMRDGTVNTLDVVLLTTHVLFFANTVLNLTLAAELIESHQDKVLQDYRDSIRSKRLRKAFNKVKRKAANNNTSKISEKAEVICYINKRKQFQAPVNASETNSIAKNLKFEDHKIKYNGIIILDPLEYTFRLLRLGIFNPLDDEENNSSMQTRDHDDHDDNVMAGLRFILSTILERYYSNHAGPILTNLSTVYDYEQLLEDIRNSEEPEEILKGIFNIALKMIEKCSSIEDYLVEAVTFIWCYVKHSAKVSSLSLSAHPRVRTVCRRIVAALLELIDTVLQNLLPAFKMHLDANRTA